MPQLKLRIVCKLLSSGDVLKEGTSAFPLTVQWARTGSTVCWRCLHEWCQRALISPVGRWWKEGLEGSDRNNEDEVLLKFCTWLIVRWSLLCKAKGLPWPGLVMTTNWRKHSHNRNSLSFRVSATNIKLGKIWGEPNMCMLKGRRLTSYPSDARQAFGCLWYLAILLS